MSEPVVAATDTGVEASRRWRSMWRLHVYAGIFAMPFVLMAATGLVILYTQPIQDAFQADPRSVAISTVLGCGPSAARVDAFTVTDTWARATPSGATNGVIYFDVASPRDAIVQLPVTSAVAADAQIHESMATDACGGGGHDGHDEADGSMTSIKAVARIERPAGRPVVFAPGGRHIMLVGLKKPLEDGTTIELAVHLASGAVARVQVPVRVNAPDLSGGVPAASCSAHLGCRPRKEMVMTLILLALVCLNVAPAIVGTGWAARRGSDELARIGADRWTVMATIALSVVYGLGESWRSVGGGEPGGGSHRSGSRSIQ